MEQRTYELGAYEIPEAARLARVSSRTAHRWFCSPGAGGKTLLHRSLPSIDGKHAVTFLDLIDLLVVGRLRAAGISMPTIRKAYAALASHFKTPHPFSAGAVLVNGPQILIDYVRRDGTTAEGAVSGQRMFAELQPWLERVDFGASGVAQRFKIADRVVVDPLRAFGKPVVSSGGTTTYVLWRAFLANKRDLDLVADLYGVTPDDVSAAVDFEERLKSNAAA